MFKIKVCQVAQEVRSIHISIKIDRGLINQDSEFDRSLIDVQSIEIKSLTISNDTKLIKSHRFNDIFIHTHTHTLAS